MSRNSRNGSRKPRGTSLGITKPRLGYYIIFTDTEKTEYHYLSGLKNSIPKDLQQNLVMKIFKTKTENLVQDVLQEYGLHQQYGEPWIIFDRDKVTNFDAIIKEANEKGVKVGWTNQCIEEWFSAYFGTMPTYSDSVKCCKGFSDTFKKKFGQKYDKADKDIYAKLCVRGNEQKAIEIAKRKFKEQIENGNQKPSVMCPCTTVHILVEEIKSKI